VSAEGEIRRATQQVTAMTQEVYTRVVLQVQHSIQYGSPVTGAPGQPVDTAALLGSWGHEFETPTRAFITTSKEYAEAVDDGIGPHGPVVYGAKNGIGGSGSVKQTAANMQKLVDIEVATVARLAAEGAGGAP
jgi:hypothetical protein